MTMRDGHNRRNRQDAWASEIRADERRRIVARIRHSAGIIDGSDVSRTARTLNRIALVIEAEGRRHEGADAHERWHADRKGLL